MNIKIAMLSALMIVMTIGVNTQAADLTDWMVVDGESKSYLDSKEAELVLRGALEVEDYGEPGVSYFRVPYRYWLKTGDGKLLLNIHDGVFPPLDGKSVEVKGKMQAAGPSGQKRLRVGWIRVLGKEHNQGASQGP